MSGSCKEEGGRCQQGLAMGEVPAPKIPSLCQLPPDIGEPELQDHVTGAN